MTTHGRGRRPRPSAVVGGRATPYLYLLPALLVYGAFLLYPLLRSVQFSLYDWPGFGPQRNRAHHHIETDWVLWLDADERLTDTLRQSIRNALANTPANAQTIFQINRLSEAFGKFIHHCGWYPDKIIRLYPTAYTRYNDNLVHESVIRPAGSQTILLQGDLLHHTYQNINQYLSKQQQYTHAWAQQRVGKKKATPLSAAFHGLGTFIVIYILKRGFLDGQHGLLIALLNSYYTFLKYTQLWFLNRNAPK